LAVPHAIRRVHKIERLGQAYILANIMYKFVNNNTKMDRKKFISTFAPLSLAFTANAKTGILSTNENEEPTVKKPRNLKPGDTIGITCPAGYLTNEEVVSAKLKLEEWGFVVKMGKTIGTRNATFADTDEARKNDFQAMLDDKTVKAIMCGRGGYGCNRIIDDLNFSNFQKNPKWLIGFSDITLLHTHINTLFNIATLHSKMCNSFLTDWSKVEALQMDSINSIKDCLLGKKMRYTAVPNARNKVGTNEGMLVGGNLSIIYSAMKTKSELNTTGKILFLEEIDEKLYSIDRMLWNLKRSGSLKNLKGLIIGGFKHKPSDKPEEEFGETVVDIVHNLTKEYNYPICFDFPVGHQKVNYALKCGVKHKFIVTKDTVNLVEM
jgi:muramoyltetrapeptide carboxypeptidase